MNVLKMQNEELRRQLIIDCERDWTMIVTHIIIVKCHDKD